MFLTKSVYIKYFLTFYFCILTYNKIPKLKNLTINHQLSTLN